MSAEHHEHIGGEALTLELGLNKFFQMHNITPLQRNAAAEFYGYGNEIDGFEVKNCPQVNLQYGLEMTKGSVIIITCDGKLCIVNLPDYKKYVAVLFGDLQSWNPSLSVPPRISRRHFLGRSALAAGVGILPGMVSGAAMHWKKYDEIDRIRNSRLSEAENQEYEKLRISARSNTEFLKSMAIGSAIGATAAISVTEVTRRAFLAGLFGKKK